jgi:hypothetical protein
MSELLSFGFVCKEHISPNPWVLKVKVINIVSVIIRWIASSSYINFSQTYKCLRYSENLKILFYHFTFFVGQIE